jgi:hypothetical protein
MYRSSGRPRQLCTNAYTQQCAAATICQHRPHVACEAGPVPTVRTLPSLPMLRMHYPHYRCCACTTLTTHVAHASGPVQCRLTMPCQEGRRATALRAKGCHQTTLLPQAHWPVASRGLRFRQSSLLHQAQWPVASGDLGFQQRSLLHEAQFPWHAKSQRVTVHL